MTFGESENLIYMTDSCLKSVFLIDVVSSKVITFLDLKFVPKAISFDVLKNILYEYNQC